MIAFPGILAEPATQAGIPVPDDPDSFDSADNRRNYPQFFIFCVMQLGAPMPTPNAAWENAEFIASIPVEKLKTMTAKQIVDEGFQIGYSK